MKPEDWILIDLTKKDGLPKDDEYVLWRCQNGNVIHDCINADHNEKNLEVFLRGNFFSGPKTHWQRVEQPKNSLSELNKVNMEVEFRSKARRINEVCFCLVYESTGEIRQKRVTPEWLMNRVFKSELVTWKKNGEGELKLEELKLDIEIEGNKG